jgi:PPOX class probable F420-dependent enzyme
MPLLDPADARERFAAARVVRLGTAGADGVPHLVPVTFAVLPRAADTDADTVTFAVDHKPKTTTALRRLANIEANPAVCLLADHYDEDWAQLWWVRADGTARVLPPGDTVALDALARRYSPYREIRPAGPVVIVTVARWSGWSAAR